MAKREELHSMQEAWRAYLDLALGFTETSRKRALKVAKKLVGRGGATAEQLQSMAEDLVNTSLANRESLVRLVRFELDKALGRVGLATAEEVAELTKRVRELEEELKVARAGTAPVVTAPMDDELAASAAVPAAAAPARTVRKVVAKKAVTTPAAPTATAATVRKAAPTKAAPAKKATPVAAPVTPAAPTKAAPTKAVAKKVVAKAPVKVVAKKAVARKTTGGPAAGSQP
jgi:polyhydroxyalkanoate synthesis regulator phasin